jgi:ligand-binding sensor domain-containing protein
MKKLVMLFTILIYLFSCDKSDDIAKNIINIDFNKKILNGFFVISIAFDSNGNTWIGTFKQGLIKYNSNETVVYNSDNSTIPDTAIIWDLAVDSKNNVWIGGEGLMKYDGNMFTYYNSSNSPIPENNVMSIAIDSKDNIWFSSCVNGNGGLVKFDDESWIIFTPDNSKLPTNIINDIAADKDDNIWVTTHSKTLSKISNDNLTTYSFDTLNGSYYSLGDIAINKRNDIYIVINNGAFSGGIWACKDCSKILIFNELKSEELYNDNILLNIKSLFIDSNNNIWCIDYNYFTIYNGINWITDNSSLEKETLFAIAQALDDKIWIGTNNGIYINH